MQSYDEHTVHETVTVASPPAIATVSFISTGGVGTVQQLNEGTQQHTMQIYIIK